MVKVRVPNKNYDGEVAGVRFNRGEAVFENEALAKALCDDLGYELVKEEPKEEAPKEATKKKAGK